MLAIKKRLSMKELKKTLRRKWKRGPYTDFDELLSETAHVNLEAALRIRQSWEDLELLAYDSDGLLVWCNGWLK
jgi:hypothetical protein